VREKNRIAESMEEMETDFKGADGETEGMPGSRAEGEQWS